MGFMAYSEMDENAATRFGTVAFYASLGRAFVTMCAVIPVLFVVVERMAQRGTPGRVSPATSPQPAHGEG